jgi:DHA2 family multidrug resistance protein
MALRQLTGLVRQQGTVMAFADVFLMLAVLFVLFGAMAVILRRPDTVPGAAAGH